MDKSVEKILDRLPYAVKLYLLNNSDKNNTEIRIRAGFDIKVCADGEYRRVPNTAMDEKTVFDLFYSFCDYTISAYENQISNGFITINGGHRIGVAGLFANNASGDFILQKIISMNIRIADYKLWDIPAELLEVKRGILIAGGPHSGKTTFIRSLCRILTDKNIVICDERNEIYSTDINQDFIINIPKIKGIEQAVRTMNPQIIVCDEIGNRQEAQEIINAVNKGTAFICSVHCYSIDDLLKKPDIVALLDTGAFDRVVFLEHKSGRFTVGEIRDV